VCDWNNDGRLDLVTGERNGYYTVFLRQEDSTLTNAGRIQAHGTDIVTSNNSWPWIVDWNRDGRKDLLAGQEGLYTTCNVFVYLNEGTDSAPVFGDSTPVLHRGFAFDDYRCVPLLLDLDLDGKRDLVLGEWYSSVRLYSNVGTDSNPVFAESINLVKPDPDSFSNGNPPRVNFADWDGDGDLDMITCDYYGSVFLRRNITPAGTEESYQPQASSYKLQATITRGVLFLGDCPRTGTVPKAVLFDATGRAALELHPGPNDISALAFGAYFVRTEGLGTGGWGSGRTQQVLKTE
jgi:hypothetical protein